MQFEHRLVIGTVQLGLPYGIANKTGMPDQNEANNIISVAWHGGITVFDTAKAYGQSENVLGVAISQLGLSEKIRIISKLPADLREDSAYEIHDMVRQSVSLLGVTNLAALLLHREEHLPLLDGPVGESVKKMFEFGLIKSFGISVYSPEMALQALEHDLISCVQVPASLFDRRFEGAGVFDKAKQTGKQIFVRSVLLQGVLCMQPHDLPPYLTDLLPSLEAFVGLCNDYGLPQGPVAIAWALRHFPDSYVLFGVETEEQMRMNLDSIEKLDGISEKFWRALDSIIPPQESKLLNPSLWRPAND